jgi:hypothetical protein
VTEGLIILFVGALALIGWRLVRRDQAPVRVATVRAGDLALLVGQVRAQGDDGSFAGLVLPGDGAADDIIHIQYSIEAGRLGLDWPLLTSSNLRDAERFRRLAVERGHTPLARDGNDTPYLRVEDGDLVELGAAVITDLYGLGAAEEFEVVTGDFEWQPAVSA